MIYHPAADAARAAQAACRFDEAARILEHALKAEPNHADLIAERAWLLTLAGQEDAALTLLPSGRGGVRHAALEQALHAHYVCRVKLDPLDFQAALARQHFRDLPVPEVGIKLTACLITKNEESNLPRCLASLRPLVDEIVVVDTGSTDLTVDVALAAGATVGYFNWCNDFAAARNASLDLATGDWVLWIDADEELDPTSVAAIRRGLVRPYFGGFDIEIVNLTDDRQDGGRILHYPMRLFRRHPQIRFSGAIHEQIQPAVASLGLPWARLEGARLIHHGYRPSALADGTKLARTRSLLEHEVQLRPGDGFQWFNLANAFITEGKLERAEKAAREAVKFLAPKSPWRELAWQILTSAVLQLGRPEDALVACERCEAEGDGGLMNEFERAQALLALQRLPEALEAINRCVSMPWPVGKTGDIGVATHKRFVLKAQILIALERDREALTALESALDGDPGFAPALFLSAGLRERLEDYSTALSLYRQAAENAHTQSEATKGIGRCLLALGDPSASNLLAEACLRDPDDHDLWLLWVRSCERAGDPSALLRAYEAKGARSNLGATELIEWGRALVNAGEHERALACFTEAIQREPECANAYFNAGDLLYELGAFTDAAHLYEAGLRFEPGHADAWFTLGNALAQLNLDEGAKLAYDQALALQPNHSAAMHNRQLVAA